MKRREIIKLITDHADLDDRAANHLLEILEEAGLINARYFVPDGHGMFNVKYGWEKE